jgi:starvation-inducible DNA-binding protein
VRLAARRATERGDDGTNDLLVGDALRSNEKQAWFVHQLLMTSDANGKG